MLRPKKTIYAWFDGREFRLSLYPPDAPVRPSVSVQTKGDVIAIANRKHATVFWWPVLSKEHSG